jgi:RNA polymerase sigma factor (sigma-70 family)
MNPFDSVPKEKLTRAEEEALAKDGSARAKETLVMRTMREAMLYGKTCAYGELSDEELMSLCYKALVRSARLFKPGWKRFFAYCKVAVRGDISRSFQEKNVVRHAKQVSLDVTPENMDHQLLPDPEHTAPKDSPRQGEGSMEPQFDLIHLNERWELVKGVIEERCNEREKNILTLVYQGGYNFQDIAGMLGVTRSAIQSAHAGALKKIRCKLLKNKRLFND